MEGRIEATLRKGNKIQKFSEKLCSQIEEASPGRPRTMYLVFDSHEALVPRMTSGALGSHYVVRMEPHQWD